MVCRLPLVNVGEFCPTEQRRLEWNELHTMAPARPATEPSSTEGLALLLATAELASQTATQLNPRERRLLCSLASEPRRPEGSLCAALATVLAQRFRTTARLHYHS